MESFPQKINAKEIKKKIRDYILESILFGYDEGFDDDTSFQDDGIMDSTQILELIDYIERNFPIEFEDSELTPENIDSLNKITSFICRKLTSYF